MSQTENNQSIEQYQITDEQLRLSITNINQIMQKINQTVRKTEGYVKANDSVITFVTQENLITENQDGDDTQMIKQLRNKINAMRIPLHQLHRKNKLSTVIQESRSQSGRTNGQAITPRDTDFISGAGLKENIIPKIFAKQMGQSYANADTQKIEYDDGNKMPKKITGIRKMNNKQVQCSKGMKKQGQQKIAKIDQQSQHKRQRFLKTKSMINIKFSKQNQISMSKKQQQACEAKLADPDTLRSKSKNKKGLSVMSKRSMRSEQSEKPMHRLGNTLHSKHKTADGLILSADRKPESKDQIIIKKRTITPFMISKKSVQLDKKNDSKLKNCLTRTNIRQFFMSKRINK